MACHASRPPTAAAPLANNVALDRDLAARRTTIAELKAKVKAPVVKTPRVGLNERALLSAIEDLSSLLDRVPPADLVDYAIGKLPPGAPGKRDTRRQSLVRALNGFTRQGRVQVRDGRVLL